ncbi:amino acid/polyamine/organocation transporter, APC superfamily [Enhydrobacter aerosaccus]|uniref:Amino acid/polyamine/organocation transporter, APC superfamily n=1 Tax=Enhydrobacter aerosaccus TaxID=225324 RepID=A0A1T4PL51_9HYPH|nr:amino acid permease [Enhydrobacter aerosaccus]SJZ91618.1 amino acid/polyamine/organocation transporter, APC superfamily [Enhydrobacter aerosaccus]
MNTDHVTARTPLSQYIADGKAHPLPKVLGPISITFMGIGAIIGAGIFVLTGTAAALYAGPAVIVSFVLAAIACGFVGLCYTELATLIPISGSTYTYTYISLGRFAGWLIGWTLILEYSIGAATVSVGWSGYFSRTLATLGLGIPPRLAAPTGQLVTLSDGTTATALLNLPAVAIVAVLTFLLVRGTSESSRVNNLMVTLKLAVVLAFVLLGAPHVDPANWRPFVPPNEGTFGQFGWSGVLHGASVVFFSYIGFDAVSNCTQEAKRPQRDMPIGILGSLAVSTVLYIAVAAVLVGLVPYQKLDVAAPIALGVAKIGLPWLQLFVDAGALIGITTAILVLLYGQSRIFARMAHDRLLPPVLAQVHPRLQTPWISQILIGVAVAAVAGFIPIELLSELVGVGTLFAFILVSFAVIRLRTLEPTAKRPFRVPAVPWVPLLGVLCCLVLMAGLSPLTWAWLASWIAIGLVVYFTYSRRRAPTPKHRRSRSMG